MVKNAGDFHKHNTAATFHSKCTTVQPYYEVYMVGTAYKNVNVYRIMYLTETLSNMHVSYFSMFSSLFEQHFQEHSFSVARRVL